MYNENNLLINCWKREPPPQSAARNFRIPPLGKSCTIIITIAIISTIIPIVIPEKYAPCVEFVFYSSPARVMRLKYHTALIRYDVKGSRRTYRTVIIPRARARRKERTAVMTRGSCALDVVKRRSRVHFIIAQNLLFSDVYAYYSDVRAYYLSSRSTTTRHLSHFYHNFCVLNQRDLSKKKKTYYTYTNSQPQYWFRSTCAWSALKVHTYITINVQTWVSEKGDVAFVNCFSVPFPIFAETAERTVTEDNRSHDLRRASSINYHIFGTS